VKGGLKDGSCAAVRANPQTMRWLGMQRGKDHSMSATEPSMDLGCSRRVGLVEEIFESTLQIG
jgi:hypothetical protein